MPQKVATIAHRQDCEDRGAALDRTLTAPSALIARTNRNRLVRVAAVSAVLALAATGCQSTHHPAADLVYYPSERASARVVHLISFNGPGELVPRNIGWAEAIRGGVAQAYVDTPAGLAYHDGRLFVCDVAAAVVHVWNLSSGRASLLGGTNAGFITPVAVAVDATGNAYVADADAGRVVALDAGGNTRLEFAPEGSGTFRPAAVAVFGSTLYVADLSAHVIERFDTRDGSSLGSLGGAGTGVGQFHYPTGLATDQTGRLYVCDMMNSRVQVFDASGAHLLSMGQPGDRYGDLGSPKHLAVGPDGTIFIADAALARIHLFDRRGRLLLVIGGDSGSGPGETPMPIGVAVAPSVPASVARLVPADFNPAYYLLVSNTVGERRISLFAVGAARP